MKLVSVFGEEFIVPEWSNFATLDHNGLICFWKHQPSYESMGYWDYKGTAPKGENLYETDMIVENLGGEDCIEVISSKNTIIEIPNFDKL